MKDQGTGRLVRTIKIAFNAISPCAIPPLAFSIHLVAAADPEGEAGSVEAFERKVREAALTWSTSSINRARVATRRNVMKTVDASQSALSTQDDSSATVPR